MNLRLVFFIVLIGLATSSCDSEDAPDCFKTEGDLITQDFEVGSFDRIRIEDGVRLIVKQGTTQDVQVETGQNIAEDIAVFIEGTTLVIQENSGCNLFREYGTTTATVTAVNLTQIRNSSRFEVRSQGTLNFPALRLLSNTSGAGATGKKSGDFFLTLNTNNLRILANGVSVFYLDGTAVNANLVFSDEQPRLEAANLRVDNVTVLQTSANKMILNPQLSLTGEIRGTGDIIAVNRPELVDVQTLFTGRLIFQD